MLPSASGRSPRPCALPGRARFSWTSGASWARAVSTLAAMGSSSYSTSIRATAASAAAWVSRRDHGDRLAGEADLAEGHDRAVAQRVAVVRVDVRQVVAVRTATTPGAVSAAAVSTERIRACATGLCRTAA